MLLDKNGEPAIFTHPCEEHFKGKPMSFECLHKFAVELLALLFDKDGMEIQRMEYKFGKELPNLAIKSINDKIYYIAVSPGIYPNNSTEINVNELSDMILIANYNKAQAAVAEMGFYCFDSINPSQPIMGGKFSVKYDGLRYLNENKEIGIFNKLKELFKKY